MKERDASRAVTAATIAATLMMAHHVGAKSVRDALFLSSFAITSLPLMVIAASGFSLALAMGASRMMRSLTPARFAPAGFAATAVLYGVAGLVLPAHPRASAVLLFLLVVGTGSLLTSSLWSLISECFDPNTLRRNVGRVAAGGTVGVLAGGLLAERVGALWSVTGMLPLLVVLHLMCALAARALARSAPALREGESDAPAGAERVPLRQLIRDAPYLLPLGGLVLAGTVSAGLIDYVFKSESALRFASREDLLRFFAIFNAALGLLTFLMQSTLSRHVLAKLGIGKTLATLPATAALGGFAALLAPGLMACGAARGAEAVFRGSLFRAGYELFYAPVPAGAKRAAKPIIDVGFDRLGDGLAGVLVRLMLFALPALANQAILTAAILLGLVGVWITLRLEDAYVDVLETDLMRRAAELELGQFSGSIYNSMVLTRMPFNAGLPAAEAPGVLDALRDLTAGGRERAGAVLRRGPLRDPLLITAAIDLLGDDALYPDAVRALRPVAASHTGQLLDRLLNPRERVRIRRRIPRVLAHCPTQRAAGGLLAGLADADFEVRYRCAQAMAALSGDNPELRFPADEVHAAILREATLGRAAWNQSRIVGIREDKPPSASAPFDFGAFDAPSLEYVFTLLSLTLPRRALRVAYQGLYAKDEYLRGTALEYLESVLPPEIRRALWPHVAGDAAPPPRAEGRPGEAIEEELLRSEPAIKLNLEKRREQE